MWGSTFADLAKRATELQEQATHLAAAKSLFNLDGLQQGKSGDEHDNTSLPTTSNDDGGVSTTVSESQFGMGEKQTSTMTTTQTQTPMALYAEDQVKGSLVMPETAKKKAAADSVNVEHTNVQEIAKGESNIIREELVEASAGGKDGWDEDEEEDVEEFDFDSSPNEEPEPPVFDGEADKEPIQLESMLSQQQLESSEVISSSDQILEEPSKESTTTVPDVTDAAVNTESVEDAVPMVAPATCKEEPISSNDDQTNQVDHAGEVVQDVVCNDEDDGLDDMYDDEDDDDERVENEEAPSHVKSDEEDKKVATKDVGDENDEISAHETGSQQPLTVAVEETFETCLPKLDQAQMLVHKEQTTVIAPTDGSDESRTTSTRDVKETPLTGAVDEPGSPPADKSLPDSDPCEEQQQAQESSVNEPTPDPILSEPIDGDKPSPFPEVPETTTDVVSLPPSEPVEQETIAPLLSDRTPPDHPQLAQSDNFLADRLLEQFSQQMQRLDENHQAELRERDQQHALELEKAMASINHDKCEEERQEMEKKLLEKLQAKEEQLMEILKTNEGHKLKIDVLKRELDGTRQLLAEKENAVGSVHAARENDIKDLERKLKQKDADIAATKERYEKLAAELKEVKDELESTNDSYSTLKGRVKIVATELKDRRVECRNLGIEVSELTEANESLKAQLATLQSQLVDQNRSQSEKGEELEQLRTNLAAMEERLKVAEKAIKEAGSVNEKALTAYKKKAQSALAEANARAAAASQAREEAELEARAARSTADAAMERARVAETSGKEALAEAKSYVLDLEEEKSRFEVEVRDLQQTLNSTVEQLDQLRGELVESRMAQDKLSRDLEQMCRNLEAERVKSQELEEDLTDSRRRSNELHDQLEAFREEHQRSSSATFGSGTYSDASGVIGKAVISESNGQLNLATTGSNKPIDKSDAEATIIFLQQELHDANRAIRELKETLRVAIEQQAEHIQTSQVVAQTQKSNGFHADSSNQGNDSTPLYYAMEKQAELNLARDEINRLANLLGDAESSKMEAYEAMEEMRRKMEEAQARLKRFEKMGSAAGRTSSRILNQAHTPREANRPFVVEDLPPSPDTAQDETVVDSAVVNLEYLKNVMLSYLNAKTLQEKKALVPVIGAVLCLTTEEQTKALKAIEDTGGIEGVGQALFESFGGRLF